MNEMARKKKESTPGEKLAKQIIDSQSISDITYSKNNQYTCRMLVDAVSEALKKASPQ